MKTIINIAFLLVISATGLYAQQRPNILFIAIDDLNDFVNCMDGTVKAHTPNIDRLASQGTLFTNAHAQAPICGPSRASILTGLYPSTSGNYLQIHDQDIRKSNDITQSAVFMPDYFEAFGYKTMGVGKIFHEGDAAGAFDEYGGRFSWMGPKPKKRLKYDPVKLPHKRGKTQTDWGRYPAFDSLMTDFKSAEWAAKKLQQEHDRPFFLAVGMVRPHVPLYVPQKWFDLYPIEEITTPPYDRNDYEDIPTMGQRVTEAPAMPTTEELIEWGEWKNFVQAYLACISFVDAQVGKVLEALERSSYADNTIVVLWSDHGYHAGEKNRFAKQSLWERSTRTVLIFKEPGNLQGQSCGAPVQLIDIYPTLLDMSGLPPYRLAGGHSLRPLIDNPTAKWEHPALSFYGVGNIAVRDERFRLIQYEDGSQELYDILNDPDEWHNLATRKDKKDVIKQLQKHIPEKWNPLSEYSFYTFNEYFKNITDTNREKCQRGSIDKK